MTPERIAELSALIPFSTAESEEILGSRRSPEQRGAYCETAYDVTEKIDAALASKPESADTR